MLHRDSRSEMFGSSLTTLVLHSAMCRTMAAPQKVLSPFGNGPTRRNLFGPVDREQLQVEYQTALRKDLEDASRRWGFDFVSDKPLESSDYQWEGIPDATVPLLYRSCTSGQGRTRAQTLAEATMTTKCGRLELPQSEKENIPLTLERCILDLERLQKTPEKKEEAGAKRKQTNITDFYLAKRRVVWMPRKSGE